VRTAFCQDSAAHEEKLRQALLSPEVARRRHVGNSPNAGHFALDEEADAIAALIRRFLRARFISL
jgi:pimeloyl-ACP methyl ester carboxylesterase